MDGTNTTRTLTGLAVGTVLISALFSACGFFGGSCTEEDLRIAEQIPAYDGLELEYFDTPEVEGCVAVLDVEATAEEVLGHYREALEGDGWDVSVEPIRAEGPEGVDVEVFELTARRDDSVVTIGLDSVEGQVSASISVNESAGT
jgi:hypothetical protein